MECFNNLYNYIVTNARKVTNPEYSCIIILMDNRIIQTYCYETKYHNRSRYVYFNINKLLKQDILKGEQILVRIIKSNREVSRFYCDFSKNFSKEVRIKNEHKAEHIFNSVNNNNNKILFRYSIVGNTETNIIYEYLY